MMMVLQDELCGTALSSNCFFDEENYLRAREYTLANFFLPTPLEAFLKPASRQQKSAKAVWRFTGSLISYSIMESTQVTVV